MRTVHPDNIYREIIWFCSSYLLKSGPEATRTIINSVFSEWASINNDYPSPFSWVDSRDSEQCDWLWNAMQVGVWEPAESPYPGQILVRLRHV